MDEKIHLGTLRLSSVSRNTKRGDTGLIFKVWIAYPVLDVQLAELAVGLDLAVGAGYLFHEGAQLHGLGNQRPAHGPEVGVRLWGERQVMSAISFIITNISYLIQMQFTIHNTHISYAYTFPDKNLLRIVCPTFAKYFPSFRNPFHHLILTPGAPNPS